MKRAILIIQVFLAAAAALWAREPRRGWFVEGAAGFSLLAPADLNARAEGQQRRVDFLYREGYEAQQRYSGGAFSVALEEPEGSGLQGLSGGFPVSLRVGRALGPRVAVFAGLQFLDRRKTSWLRQVYRVSDRRPDQVTAPGSYVVEVGFPEYLLAARAWIPQLGVMLDLVQGRSWTASVVLDAGPMLASLRTMELQHYKKTDADGYWTEWQQAYDMKGRGIAVALEAAARLALQILPRLSLRIEGGYALRRGARFSGPGAYAYQYRDANAAQNPQRSQWQDGAWRTRRIELLREWGGLEYTLSGNELAGYPDAEKFRLDLSGWQLSAGFSWAL